MSDDAEFSRMFWDWYIPRFGMPLVIKLSDLPSYSSPLSTPDERAMELMNTIIERGLSEIQEGPE